MKQTCIGRAWKGVLPVFALAGMGVVHGQGAVPAAQAGTTPAQTGIAIAPSEVWQAVSNRRLDAMRGGFDLGQGLQASFGIERLVYVNGNLATRISVNIPDIARMTPAQAGALATAVGTVNVIRNGPGNSFDPAVLNHATAATVIQNSLDAQHIQSLTTISTSVNNLDAFRSINFSNSLQSALVRSLGH